MTPAPPRALRLAQAELPLFTAHSAEELLGLAGDLGARQVGPLTSAEERLLERAAGAPDAVVETALRSILAGRDPLGDAFCRLRSPEERRPMGATYTPDSIIRAMVEWAGQRGAPARVVDPGTGSARFLVAAGRRFPRAHLLGVELDPFAALLARAHLAAAGLAHRAEIVVGDYRELRLPLAEGPTLFLGNPPYVRHHLLGAEWKTWLADGARARGLDASKLAGLHVHFFLATAALARPGDLGAFVTAAEWLDVNYGRLVRQLLLRDLGVESLHVVEPEALPFDDAATTAVIAGFEVGRRPEHVGLRRVSSLADLGSLEAPRRLHRERLETEDRWTPLTRATRERREGFVELGEPCRVHRGQVTGANRVWIAGPHSEELPAEVLFPSVTRARELFDAGHVLERTHHLRRVIDLPEDLDELGGEGKRQAERFLRRARQMGADRGYVARHRRAWWAVGLRKPAPILATYMARRPPAFVLNGGDARHINIAHGLYPRQPLDPATLCGLADYLSRATSQAEGRTYAGGLTKFEPREMERLLIPAPQALADGTYRALLS